MVAEAQQFAVRADYPHALISASQRFLSSVLVLEPAAFLNAVRRLTADTPLARSPAEAVMAWFILKDAVARGAECHHSWFHRHLDKASCVFRPRPVSAPMTVAPLEALSVFKDWAIEYAWGFDAVHCWPPAIRARELLRAHPERGWTLKDLAAAVYVSSATLERSFRRIFGVTALHYHARLRLRHVVEYIRANKVCIEGILVERRYLSPKDAYQLFRRLTGLTLSDVRRLSDADYAGLLDGPLALPSAEWRNGPERALRQGPTQGLGETPTSPSINA